jgi:hypothetical protein
VDTIGSDRRRLSKWACWLFSGQQEKSEAKANGPVLLTGEICCPKFCSTLWKSTAQLLPGKELAFSETSELAGKRLVGAGFVGLIRLDLGNPRLLKTGTITGPHALPYALQTNATDKPELHISIEINS